VKEVVLFDKEKRTGGNSAKASSGMNAAETRAQKEQHIDDTWQLFDADTFKAGHDAGDRKLVEVMSKESAAAVDFLESFGLNLSAIVQGGGHSKPRTHRIAPPADGRPLKNFGLELMFLMAQKAESTPGLKVMTRATVKSLLKEGGAVVGVEYAMDGTEATDKMEAGATVVATGGFGAERKLLREFVPHLSNLPTTNGPFATGDGLSMLREAGAGLTMMDAVQIHPSGFIDPSDPDARVKWLAPEALRAAGGVLLNQQGNRFVNELSYRDVVANSILENGFKVSSAENASQCAHLVLPEGSQPIFPIPPIYIKRGYVKVAKSIGEAADHMGIDASTLQKTLSEYDTAVEKGKDEFGKTVFPSKFNAEKENTSIFVMTITPSIHYTMGGVKIDTSARVLTEGDDVIPGVFAAGEVTGGIHGRNRLVGNGLLDNVVFGRIAGKVAAEQVAKKE